MRPYTLKSFLFLIIYVFFFAALQAQSQTTPVDSSLTHSDSLQANEINSIHKNSFNNFLQKNKYLNISATPRVLLIKEKNNTGKEFLFYLLGSVIFLLALFKVFYSRYYNNIFRVFFNTSLRQNQLTDLLLQARLPSMIFNIFFMISGGMYAWLILKHYRLFTTYNSYILIGISILFVVAIYAGKFFSLKFIGWVTGMSAATNQYIFVIFLINKITGIILIPFIILLAFAPANWLDTIIMLSIIAVGVLFLLRHIRSYGLLKNQLKIDRFHFLLYILGVEVMPILIIYKIISLMMLKSI